MSVDNHLIYVARLEDIPSGHCLSVQVAGRVLALFRDGNTVYALDNRCPHMGFPLDRGTVEDGILTCHWHHARFDVKSGGTFDLWADDVRVYPVEVREGRVWVDISPPGDAAAVHKQRLQNGLARNLSLLIAKGVLGLLSLDDPDPAEALPAAAVRVGLTFGTAQRERGWGQGLTILACMANLLPHLDVSARPLALYHGLSAVAADVDGQPPRYPVEPLPTLHADYPTLARWFRRFVEMRDADGAERCIASAVRAGADARRLAAMLFTAATDHRYIDGGHILDFTNKAFEALDTAGWDYAEPVLTSLARGYAHASRSEERSAWRTPVDLVALLEAAFTRLPEVTAAGRSARQPWAAGPDLLPTLLGDDPAASVDGLLHALERGATPVQLAEVVAYAAALRIARFHTSNEFSDWDTALHTFTFANAVLQGLRRITAKETNTLERSSNPPLLRGVFDAAMSVYLGRFLNIPAARLPEPSGTVTWEPESLLKELPALLDRQQQVDGAGRLVAGHLYVNGSQEDLLAALGDMLLREDRDFHTIQAVEAAFRLFDQMRHRTESTHVLVAAARYLAAHAPTARAQGQTYQIAHRLHRGEALHTGE